MTAVEKVSREPDPAELDLRAWFNTMGGGGAEVEITVTRVAPATWRLRSGRTVSIAGKIPGAKYNEMINEDFLEENFGGGTYRLQISRRDPSGRMNYWKNRTVKISGDPKIDESILAADVYQPEPAASAAPARILDAESPSVTTHVVDTMKEVLDDMRNDKNRSPLDPQLLEMVMAPLRAQLEVMQRAQDAMQKQLADKDMRILELIGRKPDTTTQDVLIGKMWDSESGRIEAIRTQHASEINQLRQSFADREKALIDQHSRAIDAKDRDADRVLKFAEASYQQQLRQLEDSYKQQLKNAGVMTDVQVESLKNRNADLVAQVAELKAKVGTLEAIKHQTVVEKANEVKQLREALRDERDDDDDDKAPTGIWGTIGRIAEGVIENPEVIGQMLGARGAPPPTPPAEPQFRVMRTGDGRHVRVPVSAVPQMMAAPAPVQVASAPVPQIAPAQSSSTALATPTPPVPAPPPVRPPSPDEMKMAVQFLEGAFSSGQDPAVVATSARALVPTDILAYLEKVGVDQFLGNVPNLDQGSPLRTVQGRSFVRKVAKVLLTGSAE